MSSRPRLVAFVAVAVLAAACAMDKAAPPPTAPKAEGDGHHLVRGDAGAPAPPGMVIERGSDADPDGVGKGAVEEPDAWRRRQHAVVAAQAELDHLTIELESTMSSCQSACGALRSMERAVAHLCDLTRDHGADARRCAEAEQRLAAARAKVRATCTCP
ncbi:MAG: hypothetical protein JNL38_26685 [Myxococcales bacterium]|nr:hypothetical protein [Myxococcales bacterium]